MRKNDKTDKGIFAGQDDVSLEIRYYTYTEVAKILRCSERTVHNRVRNGDIVPLRNGRLVLFTQQSIEEFLNRQNKQMALQL
jgi:excisionase family DNA binding protein